MDELKIKRRKSKRTRKTVRRNYKNIIGTEGCR